MRRPWLLSIDLTSVVVFVAVGRASHGEDASGFLHTAAPFLIAVVLGWVVMRAWRTPGAVRTGIGVMATTLVAGMALRHFVFDDGTALSFMVVAAAFLTLFLVGWRLAAKAITPGP
ncbi:MAG TPA: DUF3054 domain-containing protein [Acidimicrobiia bacterium]|nr:DUF3054 domain-containing protein [Acidimicrobiia bacterium]